MPAQEVKAQPRGSVLAGTEGLTETNADGNPPAGRRRGAAFGENQETAHGHRTQRPLPSFDPAAAADRCQARAPLETGTPQGRHETRLQARPRPSGEIRVEPEPTPSDGSKDLHSQASAVPERAHGPLLLVGRDQEAGEHEARGLPDSCGHRSPSGPAQEKMSLTRPKRSLSRPFDSAGSSISSSFSYSSRWVRLSRLGTLRRMLTYRSPRGPPAGSCSPLPRRQNTAPCCVPAGTEMRDDPSSVGTCTSTPRVAWGGVIGSSTIRFGPSRRNRGCSFT